MLATARGQVKKTRLTDFDSPRTGGVIAINLREDDELVGAALIEPEQDLLLVTRKAMSICFKADDAAAAADGPGHRGRPRHLAGRRRPAAVDDGRAGGRRRPGRHRAAASPSGPASRTTRSRAAAARACSPPTRRPARARWSARWRSTLGDELYAITSGGGVIRTPVNGVRHNKDRATMGVKLMNLPEDVSIVAIARTTDNDEPDA